MKAKIVMACGLIFYWPLFRAPFTRPLLAAGSGAGLGVDGAFFLMNVAVVVVAAAIFASWERMHRWACAHPVPLEGGLAMVVGVLFLLVPAGAGAPLLKVAGLVLYSLGFSLLTVAWFAALSVEGERAAPLIALSFALSFSSVVLEYLPAVAYAGSFVVLPGGSAILCWLLRQKAGQRNSLSESALNRDASAGGPSMLIVVAVVVCLIANIPSRGIFNFDMGSYFPTSETPKTYIFSAVVAAALFGIMKIRQSFSVRQGIALIALAALLLVGSFALASTDNGMPLNATVHTCLQFQLWITLLVTFCACWRDIVRASCLFLLIDSAISLCAGSVLPVVLAGGTAGGSDLSLPMALASVAIIAVASIGVAAVGVARSFSGLSAASQMAQSAERASRNPCGEACGSYGGSVAGRVMPHSTSSLAIYDLSPREAEVALLVARGYSVKKIAELLYLAPGTVQSHMKSVYRKLDVHSKQEVIDLLQQGVPEREQGSSNFQRSVHQA